MFIELTARNGEKVLVNINQIEGIEPAEGAGGEKALIGFSSREGIFVKESLEEIASKLALAGKLLWKY
ncbi:hypothetical protein [Oceanobacillus sp. J11TS1]|uniref:hypothetical protein n=1 Tax=Oceanobacillus sp. J11TS1 TaxID=2807191 RepID=UPI001BB3A7FA|nr:hypothetical protein [Oceanobacillus sp. J11TS1]